MKRCFIILMMVAWSACMSASAQPADPVLEHYRAYQAALARGDLVVAEASAFQALAASEARDGDGGSTAVLALNLATVRFTVGDVSDALVPARRALALANAYGAASGVSPSMARLIVARAELASGDPLGAINLSDAIGYAERDRVPGEEILAGAMQLARWRFREERYREAGDAWAIAVSYIDAEAANSALPLAQARTGQAASLMMENLGNRRRRGFIDVAQEAHQMLSEAARLLEPVARVAPLDAELTLGQRAYGEALAWRAALRAKLQSDGQRVPEVEEAQGDADGLNEVALTPEASAVPRCLVSVRPRSPSRLYPAAALDRGNVAGVALRLRINDAGEVTEAQSVATVGRREFTEAVARERSWIVERRDDSPPHCRMAMAVMFSVAFSMR